MNKKIKIAVNQPCGEKYSAFDPTEQGGFCDACQKEVIDFTGMTDQQIAEHFQNVLGKTCGRFTTSQLKEYEINNSEPPIGKWAALKAGVAGLSFLSLLPITGITAQNSDSHIRVSESPVSIKIKESPITTDPKGPVSGRVMTDGEGVPFVNVVLYNSDKGVTTDFDGNFSFPDSLEVGDVLVFSYLGYETEKISMTSEILRKGHVEVTLIPLEIQILGAVNIHEVYSSKPGFWTRVKSWFI